MARPTIPPPVIDSPSVHFLASSSFSTHGQRGSVISVQLEGAYGSRPSPLFPLPRIQIPSLDWQPTLNRFKYNLSDQEIDRQLLDRDKKIHLLQFPVFDPNNEADFEDWLDKAAAKSTRARVCLDIFREVWATSASPVYAEIIESTNGETPEQLADQVALMLFPISDYTMELEFEIRRGSRQATVLKTQHYLLLLYSRYLRLCKQRDVHSTILSYYLIESIYNSIPEYLELSICQALVSNKPQPNDVILTAFHLDFHHKKASADRSVHVAYPVNNNPLINDYDQSMQVQQSTQGSKPCPPNYQCYACNGYGHYC